jgi:hypothetical protein
MSPIQKVRGKKYTLGHGSLEASLSRTKLSKKTKIGDGSGHSPARVESSELKKIFFESSRVELNIFRVESSCVPYEKVFEPP